MSGILAPLSDLGITLCHGFFSYNTSKLIFFTLTTVIGVVSIK